MTSARGPRVADLRDVRDAVGDGPEPRGGRAGRRCAASRSSVSRIVTGSPLQTSTTVPGGVDSRAAPRNASATNVLDEDPVHEAAPAADRRVLAAEERRGDGGDQLRPVRLSGAVDHGDPQDAHPAGPTRRANIVAYDVAASFARGVGRGRRRLVTAEVLLHRAGEDDPRGGVRLRHRGEQVDREPLVGAHHREDEVERHGRRSPCSRGGARPAARRRRRGRDRRRGRRGRPRGRVRKAPDGGRPDASRRPSEASRATMRDPMKPVPPVTRTRRPVQSP